MLKNFKLLFIILKYIVKTQSSKFQTIYYLLYIGGEKKKKEKFDYI